MSITVTPAEIEQFRSLFASLPDALAALNEIEDCDGDLEDASIALAIQSGQEPDTNERWIDGLAKRWRHVVCQAELKHGFTEGLSIEVVSTLAAKTTLPLKLAVPVAIYVSKTGIDPFCEPYEQAFESAIRQE
jgi:hypothetical protein